MAVYFHTEDTAMPHVLNNGPWKHWLHTVARSKGLSIAELNYIFCSDEYLWEINHKYLDHDEYTDIITFDNSDGPKTIEGDIYISTERVQENARKYGKPYVHELTRVISHGLLHLCGLKDKSPGEKKIMRRAEQEAIRLAEDLGISFGI
jgi:rRNA maturation RNase YbeY